MRQHPFRAVGGPDADAVALGHADRHQRPREPFDFVVKFGPSEALARTAANERRRIRGCSGSPVEQFADTEFKKRGFGLATDVAQLRGRVLE